MVRYGVIFGLIFQSLALIWCTGRMPDARAAMGAPTCATTPAEHDAACCCEDEADASSPAGTQVVQVGVESRSARCCQCPLTLDQPRVPAVPDRRPSAELARVPIAIASALVVAIPARVSLELSSVPASIHPPDFAGRLACERFCRWTI